MRSIYVFSVSTLSGNQSFGPLYQEMRVSSSLIALLVLLMSCFVTVNAVIGEIVSCPGCKLNKLPEVRQFFKGAGHADSYNDLKITFIQGRNPDLLIKNEAGEVLERIDLSRMRNSDIHALMAAKGFTRKEGSPPLPAVDNGIPSTPAALAVPSSDISKIGSLASGLPIQRINHEPGLRSSNGARLRKRQESLMKAMAKVADSADSNTNSVTAALRK